MTDSTRARVIDEILRWRVSAIIRTDDERLASDAMRAAVAGGFRMIEFTLTTPNAVRLIEVFAKDDRLLVGAGPVMSPGHAREAVEAGARFLVSPVCNAEVIATAHGLGVASIPGTVTPAEMITAHRHGADFVKLFPAPPDVADYVASILGPLPYLRIFPTHGVTADNFLDILRSGAAGVGFVKHLFDPNDLSARNFAAIEERAAQIIRRLESLPNAR